jgi:sigma-54 dependent transcriptional regulator, acetoin dehydrogenase operon transcriptional activator AcoR
MPPEGLPPPLILDSWARCLDTGLVPEAAVSVPVVEAADLAFRRERSEFVRRLAQAELETLSRQIAGSNFLLAFADHDGVILDLYADNRFSMSSSDAGILSGSLWSENLAGTNGLGTALATGQAVAVSGMEHYFLKLGGISCTAAPVRDAHGQVVGVLDASSYFESRQKHTLALVQMAATHIENGLLAHQMQGHLVLALHPRAEFLGTLSAALLAFDLEGRLLAINAPGRSLLVGLELQAGTRFEELFREPLEHVLARFHRHAEVRLRDALGSVLVARMVGRPTGALRLTAPLRPALTSASPPALTAPFNAAAGAVVRNRGGASSPGRAVQGGPRVPDQALAPSFLADDPAVAEACRLVQAAVRMNVPLLLHGETGTGKEVLARFAHQVSGRQGDFVAVNCAALSADLFEAELFGYVSGAFTGARKEGIAGLIVSADGGTLLLDEIRELPLPMQAALLRFLDDQTVRPLGGQVSRQVNVQLLAACHADLEEAVLAKAFREDLLYRLNTVRVTLPPLRQRRDFSAAVHWALRGLDPQARIDAQAVALLAQQRWPGNFRELRSVLTRALLGRAAALHGESLSFGDLQSVLPQAPHRTPGAPNQTTPGATTDLATGLATDLKTRGPGSPVTAASSSALQLSAAELVRAEHLRQGGSVSKTARVLGISRTTVYRHLAG